MIGANTSAPGETKQPLIFGPEPAIRNLLEVLLYQPTLIRNFLTSAIQ